MTRSTARVPQPRLHKPTGQAYVRLNKKFVYLGKHGSAEAQAAYDALLSEWLASGRTLEVQPRRAVAPAERLAAPVDLTINELAVKWLEWADGYYVKDGRKTRETATVRLALRPLLATFGPTAARELGPMRLKAVRDGMVSGGLCRNETNRRVRIIVRMYRWAVENELIPPDVWEALRAVPGLKKGRSAAPDHAPRRPVPREVMEATLPYLAPVLADMVRVQSLTGMRTGEVVIMRAVDIDRSGDVWTYRPADHKTRHAGHERAIAIGPRAQAILVPYLNPKEPEAYLFSPRSRLERWRAELRVARMSPVPPSQENRRKANPKRVPRERYDANSYAAAVNRALWKANRTRESQGLKPLPGWSPYNLRHAVATEVRDRFGLEAAQAVLSHTKAETSEIYARASEERAREVARAIG